MSGRMGTRRSRVGFNLLGLAVLVVMIFPVYWMASSSFIRRADITGPDPNWAPIDGTLDNYRRLFSDGQAITALQMSLLVTLLTVAGALVIAFLAAVALSRFRFRGRKGFVVALLVIQMIPAEGLFISQHKMLEAAGLLNTVVGLGLIYLATVLPFTIWTLRGFAAGVPIDLEEAAMVDGCTRVGAFLRVTFPLLAPGFVATGVFGFIYAWNEFTLALVVMTRPDHGTLPLWLTRFADTNRGTDWGAIMAGSTLIAIPVIIFFLAVQHRLAAGLTAGAVKG